jgi:hypothetical protein
MHVDALLGSDERGQNKQNSKCMEISSVLRHVSEIRSKICYLYPTAKNPRFQKYLFKSNLLGGTSKVASSVPLRCCGKSKHISAHITKSCIFLHTRIHHGEGDCEKLQVPIFQDQGTIVYRGSICVHAYITESQKCPVMYTITSVTKYKVFWEFDLNFLKVLYLAGVLFLRILVDLT